MPTITAPPHAPEATPAAPPPPDRLLYRIPVDKYEAMVDADILNERAGSNSIEGVLVQKMVKKPDHDEGSEGTWRRHPRRRTHGLARPHREAGADTRPRQRARARHLRGPWLPATTAGEPGPDDVALVVEVAQSSVAADRALAATYGGGQIPAYWIVNVVDRQIEVYSNPKDGVYPPPRMIAAAGLVDLVIDGQVVAQIPAADLLPLADEGQQGVPHDHDLSEK